MSQHLAAVFWLCVPLCVLLVLFIFVVLDGLVCSCVHLCVVFISCHIWFLLLCACPFKTRRWFPALSTRTGQNKTYHEWCVWGRPKPNFVPDHFDVWFFPLRRLFTYVFVSQIDCFHRLISCSSCAFFCSFVCLPLVFSIHSSPRITSERRRPASNSTKAQREARSLPTKACTRACIIYKKPSSTSSSWWPSAGRPRAPPCARVRRCANRAWAGASRWRIRRTCRSPSASSPCICARSHSRRRSPTSCTAAHRTPAAWRHCALRMMGRSQRCLVTAKWGESLRSRWAQYAASVEPVWIMMLIIIISIIMLFPYPPMKCLAKGKSLHYTFCCSLTQIRIHFRLSTINNAKTRSFTPRCIHLRE